MIPEFSLPIHKRFFQKILKGAPEQLHSIHMTGLFFTLSGLDLLNALDESVPDKQALIDWIYSQQVKPNSETLYGNAGFRACSTMASEGDSEWDYGNLASTYCALSILLILGDDLSRVDKNSIVNGLKALQNSEGSFRSHRECSEADMRFLFCACAISAMIGRWEGVNKEAATEFVKNSMSYDSGIGLYTGIEGHGGSTYCAISSLFLMGTLDQLDYKEKLLEWLVQRQEEGFNSRPNKFPDSCYGYWIGLTLQILNHLEFITPSNHWEFYKACEFEYGGFSKYPNNPPDLVHGYLSLCTLSILGLNKLEAIYGPLGISLRASKGLNLPPLPYYTLK